MAAVETSLVAGLGHVIQSSRPRAVGITSRLAHFGSSIGCFPQSNLAFAGRSGRPGTERLEFYTEPLEDRTLLATLMIDTSDNRLLAGSDNQGWYSNGEDRVASNDIYFTGVRGAGFFTPAKEYRGFLSFDLSTLPAAAEVTSVTLELTQGTNNSAHTGPTPASVEIYDVSTPASTLKLTSGQNPTISSDLGTGNPYGMMTVTSTISALHSTSLNSFAVSDIEAAAGQYFSVGTHIVPAADTHLTFGATGSGGTQRLVVVYEGDPPEDIAFDSDSLSENAGDDALVGMLTAVNPDGGSVSFALVSGLGDTDNAAFSINGNQLAANSSFDFETKSTYSIRVEATDEDGTYEEQLTVNVQDENESASLNYTAQISTILDKEDTTGAIVVGSFTVTDPDDSDGDASETGSDGHVLSISGDDASFFTIDGTDVRFDAGIVAADAQSAFTANVVPQDGAHTIIKAIAVDDLSLQDQVDNAADGSTVNLISGVYSSFSVTGKSLIISGNGSTFVSASPALTVDNATLTLGGATLVDTNSTDNEPVIVIKNSGSLTLSNKFD